MPLRLAILISGRGSNMKAIHQSILAGRLDATIQLVVSDQADAKGLEYAQAQGIPTAVLTKQKGETRTQFDQRLIEKIDAAGNQSKRLVHHGGQVRRSETRRRIDIVVLAGYMRLLSEEFVDHYWGRLVNIHPSLLPKFPGLHAQRQALAAGAKVSGCTVHFVDEGCDTGPIIAQRQVPILPEDDEATLSERILVEEHQLYSECLQKIAEGKVQLVGGKVTVEE